MKDLLQRWNKCFSYSKLPMLFIDNNFNVLSTNDAFRRRLGYEAHDLLEMNLYELLLEDPTEEERLEQLILEEKYYSFLIKLHFYSKTQEVISTNACINSFFTTDGDFEEGLVVLNPIGYDYHLNFGLLKALLDSSSHN